MTKSTFNLSESVYQVPMDRDALVITARITVIWGQIESHLDMILMTLLKLDATAYRKKFNAKMAATKLREVRAMAKKMPNNDARQTLEAMDQAIQACLDDRNVMTHGLWGWHYNKKKNQYRIGAHSNRRQKPFWASELPKLHEQIIKVSITVDRAWYTIVVGVPAPTNRNRPQIFDLPMKNNQPTAGPPPRLTLGW